MITLKKKKKREKSNANFVWGFVAPQWTVFICVCEHRRICSHQLYLSIIRVITQEKRTQRGGQQLCMKAFTHYSSTLQHSSHPSQGLSAWLLNFTQSYYSCPYVNIVSVSECVCVYLYMSPAGIVHQLFRKKDML